MQKFSGDFPRFVFQVLVLTPALRCVARPPLQSKRVRRLFRHCAHSRAPQHLLLLQGKWALWGLLCCFRLSSFDEHAPRRFFGSAGGRGIFEAEGTNMNLASRADQKGQSACCDALFAVQLAITGQQRPPGRIGSAAKNAAQSQSKTMHACFVFWGE